MTDHTVTQDDMDAAEAFLRRHQRTPNSLVYDVAEMIHVHGAALAAGEQRTADGWIPVSERLPDDQNIDKLMHVWGTGRPWIVRWTGKGWVNLEGYEILHVTHWHLFPAAPLGE